MGALSRLTRPQVVIIGAVLIVLTAAGLYFGLVRPLQQRMAAADAKYTQNEPNGNEAAQKAAADEKKQAQAEVAAAKTKWRSYEGRFFSPAIDISNLLVAMQQRWKEQSLVLGPKVVSYLRRDPSVVTQANIAVPAPPSDPNAVNTHLFIL